MILEKLVVGPLGTNCYLFGTDHEIIIIDPGGDSRLISQKIENLDTKPIGLILTHGHFDHTLKVVSILKRFKIPLMFNKKEFDSGIFSSRQADKWIKEGDIIKIGNISLNVLETPGHSPGSISLYSKDIKILNENSIDGIIFTGDLIFRRSIGRSDISGGNQNQLFSSIRNKIMYNPELTDNFIIFPGHMGNTTIGEERKFNMFKNYFL